LNRYFVYVNPDTFNILKQLPGNIRQRVRKAIKNLEENPRPSNSKQLTVNITDKEVWRLRIDNWRIIYGIKETDRTIGVIAARKRPPYEYEDLQELLNLLELD
jgi:mRNA interferase RelE/StbE